MPPKHIPVKASLLLEKLTSGTWTLKFDFRNKRADEKGNDNIPLLVRREDASEFPLNAILVENVVVSGMNAPLTAEALKTFNASLKFPLAAPRKESDVATLTVREYGTADLKLAKDGFTHLTPPDAARRVAYYSLVELINNFARTTFLRMKQEGLIILQGELPPGATPHRPGQDVSKMTPLVVPNAKIVSMVQTHVSDKARSDPGRKLPAGLTRIKIPTKKGSPERAFIGTPHTFYDVTKPLAGGGYEPLLIEGKPVTDYNVHLVARAGLVLAGAQIILDTVSCSNMGISIPAKLYRALVQLPSLDGGGLQADAFFGEMGAASAGGAAVVSAAAAATAVVAAAEATAGVGVDPAAFEQE